MYKTNMPSYFSRLYKLRWDTLHKLFYNPFRVLKWRRQRLKYGVSDYDSFSFYSYLEVVLANGLERLVNDKHGIPCEIMDDQSELTDADVDRWDSLIKQAHADALWLCAYEDKTSQLYEEHFGNERRWESVEIPGSHFVELREINPNEEITNAWHAAYIELEAEREMHKDRLMDFLKKWHFSLWD